MQATEKILIVDDDMIDRRTVMRYLRGAGSFDFALAGTVKEARRLLDADDYVCVLLDFCLPDGDAFDVLRHLTQLTAPPPTLVMTGVDADEFALDLLAFGAEDYLPKDRLCRESLRQAVDFARARYDSPLRRKLRPTALPPAVPRVGTSPSTRWMELFKGDVNGYALERQLGSGSMATVFLARQASLGRKVAIKVIAPRMARDEETLERFKQEARILAGFDSPFITPIYDLFEVRGYTCIVMAYAAGGSVERLHNQLRRLPLHRVLAIARDTALGLHAAAREGIVHRDIKPANLLLTRSGRVRIADFGLAKLSEGATVVTAPGIVFGSAAYMAPEQWLDRPCDVRTDLYALGCTVYELLTGRLPFVGVDLDAVMMGHLHNPPPALEKLRSDCAPEVSALVLRLLAKDPAARFQTGAAAAHAVQECLRTQTGPER